MNAEIQFNPDTYFVLKLIHGVISLGFFIIAIWLLLRSFIGFVKEKKYRKTDKVLSFCFIINLYLQLALGLLLFAAMGSERSTNGFNTISTTANRLWPVEHIIFMLFALFIANLGMIISLKSGNDKEKHRHIFFYYLVSFIMILISLLLNYL